MIKPDFNLVKKNLFLKGSRMGLLGVLLCTTEILFVDDLEDHVWGCTNGEIIKFNSKVWDKITIDDKVCLLAHEMWHIALLHCVRAKLYCNNENDLLLWNLACDISVDNILHFDFNGEFKTSQYVMMSDKKYLHWTTEEIFKDLKQNDKNQNKKPHSDIQPSLDINNFNKSLTKQDKDLMLKVNSANQINNKNNTNNNAVGKQYGALSKELNQVLENLLKPKIHWNQYLQKYFTEINKENRSYKRISRRSSNDFIFPSYSKSDKLTTINFYLDTSCSISDKEIEIFNSEILSIKKKYNPKEFNIIQFDTQIKSIKKVTSQHKLNKIEVKGRGGTCLKDVYKHIKETKPKLAIVMSDLDVYIPKTKLENIIWICSDPNNKSNLPDCGKIIHINPRTY